MERHLSFATMATKGEKGMSWLARYPQGKPWRPVCSVTFVVFVAMLFAPLRCTAQALQKGISVELAVTSNAAAMPDADKEGALIVAVTRNGGVYLGIDPITPAALAEKHGLSSRVEEKLYIKADARTPYANVMKVLDAVRKAGVTAPSLLTAQNGTPEPGKLVPPKGFQVLVGPSLPSGAESIVLQALNSGQRWPILKINNEDIPWATLQSRLGQLFTNRSEKLVLVKADGLLPFARVAHVIDVCRSTGAKVFLAAPAT